MINLYNLITFINISYLIKINNGNNVPYLYDRYFDIATLTSDKLLFQKSHSNYVICVNSYTKQPTLQIEWFDYYQAYAKGINIANIKNNNQLK